MVTNGAFGGKRSSKSRERSIAQLTKLVNALFAQLKQQQDVFEEYFGCLTQMTEAMESEKKTVPKWIVEKARLMLNRAKEKGSEVNEYT